MQKKKLQWGPCGHKFVTNDCEKDLNVSFSFFSFIPFYIVMTTYSLNLFYIMLMELNILLFWVGLSSIGLILKIY